MPLKLYNRRLYAYVFLCGCAVAGIAARTSSSGKGVETFLAVSAAAGGLTYFLYSQHIESTRLFKELFGEFNRRYNDLHAALDKINRRSSEGPLTNEELGTLANYFNLCAEEYLYYKAGYIDDLVWRSWRNGMRVFAKNPVIREYWEQELLTDSYYGFEFPR